MHKDDMMKIIAGLVNGEYDYCQPYEVLPRIGLVMHDQLVMMEEMSKKISELEKQIEKLKD